MGRNEPLKGGSSSKSAAPNLAQQATKFEKLLLDLLGFDFQLDPALTVEIQKIEQSCPRNAYSMDQISREFFGRLNEKLNINKDIVAEIFRLSASSKITFNYHQKKTISFFLNRNMVDGLEEFLQGLGIHQDLMTSLRTSFLGASNAETKEALIRESHSPSKLRKKLEREVLSDVAASAAGCLIWSIYDPASLRKAFATSESFAASNDFLSDLRLVSPELFSRERALLVSKFSVSDLDNPNLLEQSRRLIEEQYRNVSNYGYLSLIIEVPEQNQMLAWELASHVQFFGERFLLTKTDKVFFRKEEIEKATTSKILDLDLETARFDLMTEGFSYRDLFVMHDNEGLVKKLILIMQKNERDETLVPCPTCRSSDVRGNSYPSLGVKSWECQNRLCPDRSIYNRGKRYSFKSLLMQAAIEHDDNLIPTSLIRKWRRDVLPVESDSVILEMLIRFFSMSGDSVVLQGFDSLELDLPKTRSFKLESKNSKKSDTSTGTDAFFARFLPPSFISQVSDGTLEAIPNSVINGDSRVVLETLRSESFDAAVTSPPYYNAREYSQWENLYLYLHEMQGISAEVFRTLKPGSRYFFNIFDYFDNENIVTFSAMGNKRLTLAATFIEMFKKVGFEFEGISVWDKGDVEGKRSFNAGNSSPFYQAPLNCWEHMIVLRKPGIDTAHQTLNKVYKISPVMKMIRGINVLGHTAPFPIDLPKTFLSGLPKNSLILDPFGGSGTTAKAALELGLDYYIIEKDETYSKLADDLIREFRNVAKKR
jgi:DNA modification methylase